MLVCFDKRNPRSKMESIQHLAKQRAAVSKTELRICELAGASQSPPTVAAPTLAPHTDAVRSFVLLWALFFSVPYCSVDESEGRVSERARCFGWAPVVAALFFLLRGARL